MDLQAEDKHSFSTLRDQDLSENPYEPSVALLSKGIVDIYEPPLKHAKAHLDELLQEQSELLSKIHIENVNLSEVQHSAELQEMFIKIKTYNNKLHSIKKDMKSIHDRTTKLKKRAERLQHLSKEQSLSSGVKEPVIP